MPPVGLDVGTSFLIKATEAEEGINYTEFRDAFYRMKPASPIAAKMMEKGLTNLAYFKDTDGSFVVVGEDAISKALVELNVSRDEINVKIVCEEQKGLFGMEGVKPAKIKVTLKKKDNNS